MNDNTLFGSNASTSLFVELKKTVLTESGTTAAMFRRLDRQSNL